MGTPAMRAAHLVIDVNDLDRAAAFWAALLELEVTHRGSDWVDLSPLGGASGGGPVLSFQLVPERKLVKNRLHIDIAVEPERGGVVAAGRRAQALGATPASDVQSVETNPWQVWRDPEGNEFCLVTAADVIDLASSASTSESIDNDAGLAH
jgi:catechol 2,3-dioxygenase-like lactoylglutathione lyase family enzyme